MKEIFNKKEKKDLLNFAIEHPNFCKNFLKAFKTKIKNEVKRAIETGDYYDCHNDEEFNNREYKIEEDTIYLLHKNLDSFNEPTLEDFFDDYLLLD